MHRFVKTGRTHLMDAMPVRLSQVLEGWAHQVEAGTRLETGQTVRVPPLPDAPPPGAERPAKAPRVLSPEDAKLIRSLVVHEDADLFALNKPAGLAGLSRPPAWFASRRSET